MTDTPLKILLVCTANICRSPFAASLIQHQLADIEGVSFEVSSAGTEARGGDPACPGLWISANLPVPARSDQVSRLVTRELIDDVDLILPLADRHSSSLAILSPKARKLTFRLGMAARLAELIASPSHALDRSIKPDQALDSLDPLSKVPPLPAGPRERFGWLVSEMDAWRGSVQDSGNESVPDPHELAADEHPQVQHQISELVASFADSLKATLTAGSSER